MGLAKNRLRHEAGIIANGALGAKSVTENKQQGGCGEVSAAKRQRSPKQFPIVIGILPVRNALQGRWIFDARVKMVWFNTSIVYFIDRF
jgi:hypothetical protein